MEETAAYAEKYPDVYFAHGTGYMSNGSNFTNYFGRIYQARYLSGLVAGMKTKSNLIGSQSGCEGAGGSDELLVFSGRRAGGFRCIDWQGLRCVGTAC